MEFRKWPLAQAIYPHWSLACQLLLFTRSDRTIKTKCLPCQSAEGGTSAAIRGNWQYLRSGEDCWHQFPPQWLWWTSVAEIKRAVRSACSAEADQRFALALVLLTPLSCLGYTHSARNADSECATFVNCFTVQPSVWKIENGCWGMLTWDRSASKRRIDWQMIKNAFSTTSLIFFLVFHRIMDPWCGARITSSAPR